MPSVSRSHASISRVVGAVTTGSFGASVGVLGFALAEERDLAEFCVARRPRRQFERRVERGELLCAVAGEPVERAALDQRFKDAPVDVFGVDALREIEEIGEIAVALARLDDRSDRGLADALDRGQAEANAPRRRPRSRPATR